MPSIQELAQNLGTNPETVQMWQNAGVLDQVLQQRGYYANTYNSSPSVTAPRTDAYDNVQPQNTLSPLSQATPQWVLDAQAAGSGGGHAIGPPPGSTPIPGAPGMYVTPSGATWGQRDQSVDYDTWLRSIQNALKTGIQQQTPAAQAYVNHYQQNNLPMGYANPQMEAKYLTSQGLNPAQSTYLGNQTPSNNYFANLSGGNNQQITGPGTSLPTGANNFGGAGTGTGTGSGTIPGTATGGQQQTPAGPSIQELIDMLTGAANPTIGAPSGFNWARTDWDGDGPGGVQWGLNIANTPQNISDILPMLTAVNSLGFQGNLPVNFGAISGILNQPNESGQFTTNWGAKPEEEALFDMLMSIQGGDPTKSRNYRDYIAYTDALYGNSPLLSGQFRGKSQSDFLSDPTMLASYFNAIDAIKQQFGLATRQQILAGTQNSTPLGIGAFAGTGATANAPFSPTVAPIEGFGWDWLDTDGAGMNNPARWVQTLKNAPANQADAERLIGLMNGGNPNQFFMGQPGTNNPFTFNNNQWGVNTQYYAPKPPTPPPGGGTGGGGDMFSTILSGLLSGFGGGGGGNQQQSMSSQSTPQLYSNTSPATNTPTGPPAQIWNNQFNPNRAGAKQNFSSFPFYGYGQGQGNNN